MTAILPLGRLAVGRSVPAAIHSMNGNGEMTGSHWIAELGALSGPVMITNTHAVDTVHRGVVYWTAQRRTGRAGWARQPCPARRPRRRAMGPN